MPLPIVFLLPSFYSQNTYDALLYIKISDFCSTFANLVTALQLSIKKALLFANKVLLKHYKASSQNSSSDSTICFLSLVILMLLFFL